MEHLESSSSDLNLYSDFASDLLTQAVDINLSSKDELFKVLRTLLRSVRQQLQFNVTFIAEFKDGRRVFRVISADLEFDAIKVNDSDPLEDTYCQRIVDGRLPELTIDSALVDETRNLPVTHKLSIGSYIGVPIKLSSGMIYGTFCGYTETADPTLNQRDLALMRVFADVTAAIIESNLFENNETISITNSLLEVFHRDQLLLFQQPIIDLKHQSSYAVEILSRFTEERFAPDVFYSQADRYGLSEKTAEYFLQKLMTALPKVPTDIKISVNLTPNQCVNEKILNQLSGFPLERIIIEITEHVVIHDYEKVEHFLAPLRKAGLSLAVDDAGSGYASFLHILSLKPDIIKLDKALTHDIDKDPARRALAIALIQFANEQNIKLIAEGIETQQELDVLKSLGVRFMQGFLFSKPTPLK
ncbi:MAG: EAL domain-containing protein [Gammaproteobacteria bacterium]|nr:EAL domain-containing protein [Gammaproteobacteria bacterium]